MDVTKPYEFLGLGAMDVTKPYEFIGLGALAVGRALPWTRWGCPAGAPPRPRNPTTFQDVVGFMAIILGFYVLGLSITGNFRFVRTLLG